LVFILLVVVVVAVVVVVVVVVVVLSIVYPLFLLCRRRRCCRRRRWLWFRYTPIRIASIAFGSSLHGRGLQEGDTLIAVDGVSVQNRSMSCVLVGFFAIVVVVVVVVVIVVVVVVAWSLYSASH
jgi:hypothetical protein